MNKDQLKTSEVKKTSSINLALLAKERKKTQMKKIADWYDTSSSSCARVRGAGNGL